MIPAKLYNLLLLLLFISGLFTRCKKSNAADCFTSYGKTVHQHRSLMAFDIIQIDSKIDVEIRQDSVFKAELISGGNMLRKLETSVSSNTLFINNLNTCNLVRGYKKSPKVIISLPNVKRVINNSVGTVRFLPGFKGDTLRVRTESSGDIFIKGEFKEIRTSAHGNGDIYAEGSCNRLFVYTFGTNFLRAEDLKVRDYIFVETVTIGDCFVSADSTVFQYNIRHDGNIYYTGEPRRINDFSKGTAKGRLIRKD